MEVRIKSKICDPLPSIPVHDLAPPLTVETPVSHAPVNPLQSWLSRFQSSPDTVLLLLAVVIGSGTGLGVVSFRALIQGIYHLMFNQVMGGLSVWGHWTLALIPLLGGLGVGLIRWWVQDFGPGWVDLLAAVKEGRRIKPLQPLSKMVTAAISLGSGASLGPEGPSVEIGSNFSLWLGQVLQVSQERQHLLLAAGAAAGLAAGFNAPIAGVFFALEVVLGAASVTSAASTVLLAAVVAAWITQISLGANPAFTLPAYETRSLLELPLYVGLGLLASLVSVIFKRSLIWAEHAFQGKIKGLAGLAKIPVPLRPMLGAIGLGAIALVYPQVLGVGYETVESILQDVQLSLQFVIALLVIKLMVTALSASCGFVGGIFAPALFLGASLGSAYGKLVPLALPVLEPHIASPPAYAMVGMAAVLAATARAPLTAILLLFELTRDYRIVLPLMAAVGLSTWLAERLPGWSAAASDAWQSSAITTLSRPEAEAGLVVADALLPVPLRLDGHTSLAIAAQALVEHRCRCALVTDQQQLVGILTLQDVLRLLRQVKFGEAPPALLQESIQGLCSPDLQQTYGEETLAEAIARMSTRGLQQLPVVTQETPHQLVGLLTQEGINLADRLSQIKTLLQTLEKNQPPGQPDPGASPIPVLRADPDPVA